MPTHFVGERLSRAACPRACQRALAREDEPIDRIVHLVLQRACLLLLVRRGQHQRQLLCLPARRNGLRITNRKNHGALTRTGMPSSRTVRKREFSPGFDGVSYCHNGRSSHCHNKNHSYQHRGHCISLLGGTACGHPRCHHVSFSDTSPSHKHPKPLNSSVI